MPHPSEELIGQPRDTLRADLRLLAGIYDQLDAIRGLLAPAAPPALEPPKRPVKARKDNPCPPPD